MQETCPKWKKVSSPWPTFSLLLWRSFDQCIPFRKKNCHFGWYILAKLVIVDFLSFVISRSLLWWFCVSFCWRFWNSCKLISSKSCKYLQLLTPTFWFLMEVEIHWFRVGQESRSFFFWNYYFFSVFWNIVHRLWSNTLIWSELWH